MTSTVTTRMVRQPLVWLVLAVMVIFGALFLLESSGSSAPAQVVPIHLTSSGGGTDFGNPGGNPTKHCTDGKGKDDTHNKHCRPASGGQT